MRPDLPRQLLAEGLGTGLLVTVVVGSGIAAQRLSPHDVGLQLLENALATGAGLAALVVLFIGVSGAQFNPVVTLAARVHGELTTRAAAAFIVVQTLGALGGAALANLMFELPAVDPSQRDRSSGGLWLGEVVATFGLLTLVVGLARSGRRSTIPLAVAGWITAAYWFTSSTSFANPAVTIGRSITDTFAGIAPTSVPGFLAAQLAGGALALTVSSYLFTAPAGEDS